MTKLLQLIKQSQISQTSLNEPTNQTTLKASLNMGSGASCIAGSSSSPTATLMDSRGDLRPVELPTSVAELMIELPGHVVSRAEDLVLARRVTGMRADEQLRPGEVYLLLKRSRVGSRIDDLQVEVIREVMSWGGGGRRRRRRKRVPDSGSGGSKVAPDKEDKDTGCAGQQVGGHRQWRPLLDTIVECN